MTHKPCPECASTNVAHSLSSASSPPGVVVASVKCLDCDLHGAGYSYKVNQPGGLDQACVRATAHWNYRLEAEDQ